MNDHEPGAVPTSMRLLGASVHTGNDPDATVDARNRILRFFAQRLSGVEPDDGSHP